MHLGPISKCLPKLASSGHFSYLKSAYLYLPDMTQLSPANSERCCMLYDELTDTGWDLGCVVIEQTRMRTLMSVEQLTCCFKRSQKANTLAFMLVVKVSGEQTIESALLYERLIVVSRLCPFPPSLVEARYIMCKGHKPQLADFINFASMLFHKQQCYFGFGS